MADVLTNNIRLKPGEHHDLRSEALRSAEPLREEFLQKTAANPSPGTETALPAELKLAAKDFHNKIAGTLPHLTPADTQKMVAGMYQALDTSIPEQERIRMIGALLTQTVPGRTTTDGGRSEVITRMSAENLLPGRDPNGRLSLLESCGPSGSPSVFEKLHAAATEDLNPSLKAQGYTTSQFFTSMTRSLVDPGVDDQGRMCTCGCTCLQWNLTTENPALFVSRVTDLITKGHSLNKNGEVALKLTEIIPSDERTCVSSLLQSCMMDTVDGGYDVRRDIIRGKVGEHPGLYSRQLWHLMTETSEKPHRVAHLGDQNYLDVIEPALNERRNMVAVIEGIGTGDHLWHDVNIVGRENGYIYFRNPWQDNVIRQENGIEIIDHAAGVCRMKESEFLAKTQYIVYETNNPADYNFKPDGRDERYTAPVFTVSAPLSADQKPLTYLEILKLNELQKKQRSHEPTEKQQLRQDGATQPESEQKKHNQQALDLAHYYSWLKRMREN